MTKAHSSAFTGRAVYQLEDELRLVFSKHAYEAYLLSELEEDRSQWFIDDPDYGRINFSKEARAVFEKTAGVEPTTLSRLGNIFAKLQKPLGGANPLTATLTGAALMSALGYGGGWLAEKVLPEEHFEKGKLRRTGAIAGGLLGAMPGSIWGANNVAEQGLGGLLDGAPYNQPSDGTKVGFSKLAADYLGQSYNPLYESVAVSTGAAFTPDIDIERWKATIQSDPFLPDSAKAVSLGLPMAASMADQNSGFVSPYDIGRIALGGGWGGALGLGIGRLAQATTGLKPDGVKWLTRSGILAGAVKSLMPGLF